MQYLVISFSHKNTDISMREKLSFSEEAGIEFLNLLTQEGFIEEVILLSTCNRIEIILMTSDVYSSLQECFSKLSQKANINKDELEGRANIFEGYGAIRQIFLVSSSLDSLVIGETQISGQLKQAYKLSLRHGFCTHGGLGNVIDFSFKCASNVRNNTQISNKPISIASIAVNNAINFALETKKALIIGVGEMGRIAAKHLLNAGFEIVLCNRNIQNAIILRDELICEEDSASINIIELNSLKECINDFELILSATASPNAIITKQIITPSNKKRYFFDLAIPRDTEDLDDENIKIILIDDLQSIVESNMNDRTKDLNIAYEIVGNEVNNFFKELSIFGVEPIIKFLRHSAREASIKELKKAIKKGYLPQSCEQNLQKTIHNIFNIFLHTPTKKLKEVSSTSQIDEITRALKTLFDIDNEKLTIFSNEYDKKFKDKQ